MRVIRVLIFQPLVKASPTQGLVLKLWREMADACEKNCRHCNRNHHQSICQRQAYCKTQHDLSPNKNSQEPQNSTLVTQLTEVSQLPQKTTISSSDTKGTVLLQTASAIARNEDGSKSTGVEILFDSGSGGSLSIVDQRILRLLRIIFRLNFDEVWVFFI